MDTFEKELFDILRRNNPATKPEDFLKWSKSQSIWASRNYRQAATWISRTLKYLDGTLDEVDVEKFIINAHGLIVDLPVFIEKKVGVFKALGFPSLSAFRRSVITKLTDRGMQTHLFCLIEAHISLSQFMDNFSREDIFATTFFRNNYCHPTLFKYTMKLTRKKGGNSTFDPQKYDEFLKLQPYDESDLCKKLFNKFLQERKTLEQIQGLLSRLPS